jgi:predicted small secreted protein
LHKESLVRQLLFASALLAACSSNTLPGAGDGAAALDLAGCAPSCPDLAASAPPDFSGVDLAGQICVTLCDHCTLGGACCPGAPNGGCCARGEWCDNSACRCGTQGACSGGDFCSSGPISEPGGNQCGMTCCGGAGHPCPL